jgi:exopolysaccharide production protein ExoZ
METGTPAKLEFLPRLESLRGIAAVAVVGYHAYGLCNDTAVTGMGPVVMFFVLSGFVLARSLERNANALTFFLHRTFRLVPAAASTVLLFTLLHWQFGPLVGSGSASFNPINVLLNALMVRSDINPIMWSMTVECAATPLILGCFLAYKKFGRPSLVVLCVLLFGLSFYGPYVHLLGGATNLSPLYAFVIGVLLHFMIVQGAKPKPHQLAMWTVLSLALILVCWLRKQTGIVLLLETIGAGILIFLIAISGSHRLFAALDSAAVRFFGRISYSFYLLHVIGLSLAIRTVPLSSIPLFVFGVAFTAPLAWLSWRLVEKPFNAGGRGLVRQLARVVQQPQSTQGQKGRVEVTPTF